MASSLSGKPVVVQFNNLEVVFHLLDILRKANIVGEVADLHASAMASLHANEFTADMVKRLKDEFLKESAQPPVQTPPPALNPTGVTPAVPTGAAQRKFPQSSGAAPAQVPPAAPPAPAPVRVPAEDESGAPRAISKVEVDVTPPPAEAPKKDEAKKDDKK